MAGDARPLQPDQRRVLDLLLAEDLKGAAALRQRARGVSVVGLCDCGCPSVHLTSPADAPQVELLSRHTPVEGRVAPEKVEDPPGEIILFCDEGRLSYLEYVYYGNPPLSWPRTSPISSRILR